MKASIVTQSPFAKLMKRRKTKKSTSHIDQERRHQKNEFLKKMKQIMALLGDPTAFEMLDKANLFSMFHCRIRPYKIVNQLESKHKISKHDLKILNQDLSELLHRTTITIGIKEIRISLYDLSVYGETLFMIWRTIEHEHAQITAQFKACFPIFEEEEFLNKRTEVLAAVQNRLKFLAWLYSDFTKGLLCFTHQKYEMGTSLFDQSAYYNNYFVEHHEPGAETIEIDGKRRPIFRVYLNDGDEIVPFTLTPKQLGMDGIMQDFPFKVFIQEHVLIRIAERLSPVFVNLSYLFILTSVLTAPVLLTEKSFLFPLQLKDLKLGYLKGDMIGDKILIRTFLFITNNATPEGQKLHDLVGLKKIDKEYLGIDKLSTFILSDIAKHEALKDLFKQAGCAHLFRVNKFYLGKSAEKNFAKAGQLAFYLGLEECKEE